MIESVVDTVINLHVLLKVMGFLYQLSYCQFLMDIHIVDC